jgi:hypothetical protein
LIGVTLVANLEPMLKFRLDPDLLLSNIDRLYRKKQRLLDYANKKIRPQDIRKQRLFADFLREFNVLYERKVVEKANYVAEAQKKSKERPRFPNEGATMRFKRYSGS